MRTAIGDAVTGAIPAPHRAVVDAQVNRSRQDSRSTEDGGDIVPTGVSRSGQGYGNDIVGCLRVLNSTMKKLVREIPLGTRVRITA